MKQLKIDADREGISINSKVNNILKKYAIFYKYAEIDQPVIIPRRSLQFILENIEEQKLIEEYEEIVLDLVPSILLQQRIPISLENLIKYVFGGVLTYAGAIQGFEYFVGSEGQVHLVFKHVFGLKWSRIISSVYSAAIQKSLNLQTTTTILPSTVVIKIIERNLAGDLTVDS